MALKVEGTLSATNYNIIVLVVGFSPTVRVNLIYSTAAMPWPKKSYITWLQGARSVSWSPIFSFVDLERMLEEAPSSTIHLATIIFPIFVVMTKGSICRKLTGAASSSPKEIMGSMGSIA
uniref:Uncharacterized protein n=1 Tax=Cannabis sativa TaxID=3483 RepID=A0A803QD80_CANSA